jgi:hypothetical protein
MFHGDHIIDIKCENVKEASSAASRDKLSPPKYLHVTSVELPFAILNSLIGYKLQ